MFLLKLKIYLMRWLTPLALWWFWRGRKSTEVSVSNETMAVKDGVVRLRVYRPLGDGPFPVLLFFHGGGWVFGDLETHDPVCRDLCVSARRLVVAVDYRLAPQRPFPIPVEDCLASLDWIKGNAARLGGDLASVAICGDSAGGNLAAVVTQQARQRWPGLVKGQVLIYPVADYTANANWESYRTYGGREYGLTHASMMELWDAYLHRSPLWTAGMTRHDLATPLHVADLTRLPRLLMVLAEEDLLRDEGVDYARRVEKAGTPVEVRRYPGQRHGFVGLEPSPPYRQAIADIAAWLKAG